MKKRSISKIWNKELAYAIGLISSDGCLSSNGRTIVFTSKDLQLINIFKKALDIECVIHKNISGMGRISFRVQIGDVSFYSFLMGLGLMRRKSKILKEVAVPGELFPHYLRGVFDGDGTAYSYWDKRWKSSFLVYTEIASASREHLLWLQSKIRENIQIVGSLRKSRSNSCYRLVYAKKESLKLYVFLYQDSDGLSLNRKRLKINDILGIVGEQSI